MTGRTFNLQRLHQVKPVQPRVTQLDKQYQQVRL